MVPIDCHFHPEKIDPTAVIFPTATVLGDVTIGPRSSVWYGAVIRGDVARITIGADSNVQDGCIIHADEGEPATIGDEVTLGHRAVVHAATIGHRVIVGIGSVVLNGAVVGEDSIIGAGAIVTGGTVIPPRSLVLGTPAKVAREVTEEQLAWIRHLAAKYVGFAQAYKTTL